MMRRSLAIMAACLTLGVSLAVWAAQAPVPALKTWVTDTTGTLAPDAMRLLEARLQAVDRDKGAQIAVLMVATTGDESIESYAERAFQTWGLGRKSVDDGILLVIAKNDRTMRIEVGYGLEGAVPDILAGRIIREQIAPRFAAGAFSEGVIAGVDSLITLVDGEPLPAPAAHAQPDGTDDDDSPWIMLAPLAFMALLMPVGLGTLAIGIFAGIAFGSISVGVLVAVAALMIGLVGKVMGLGASARRVRSRSRGGRNRWGGPGGPGGGFGGGSGGGGGGASGGGGSSGGGGASGNW